MESPQKLMERCNAMQGPILRPIQRLGKLGKRSNVPQTETADPNQTKDPKFVYLSIDECGSHVGDRKTTFFRCLLQSIPCHTLTVTCKHDADFPGRALSGCRSLRAAKLCNGKAHRKREMLLT